jgi:hypothetical protein
LHVGLSMSVPGKKGSTQSKRKKEKHTSLLWNKTGRLTDRPTVMFIPHMLRLASAVIEPDVRGLNGEKRQRFLEFILTV